MQMLSVVVVAGRFPGRAGKPRLHPSGVVRWIVEGVRLPDGSRLRLRAIRAGSKWLTSEEWLAEFLDAQTRAALGRAAGETRTPTAAQAAAEAAGRELQAIGA